MTQEDKEFKSLVLVQKLKTPLSIRYHGKVIALGEEGMFLCKDQFSYLWFETFESLQVHYKITVSLYKFSVVVTSLIRRLQKRCLIEGRNGLVLIGNAGDINVLYPSGVRYVIHKDPQGKDAFFPVSLVGSKSSVISF